MTLKVQESASWTFSVQPQDNLADISLRFYLCLVANLIYQLELWVRKVGEKQVQDRENKLCLQKQPKSSSLTCFGPTVSVTRCEEENPLTDEVELGDSTVIVVPKPTALSWKKERKNAFKKEIEKRL